MGSSNLPANPSTHVSTAANANPAGIDPGAANANPAGIDPVAAISHTSKMGTKATESIVCQPACSSVNNAVGADASSTKVVVETSNQVSEKVF